MIMAIAVAVAAVTDRVCKQLQLGLREVKWTRPLPCDIIIIIASPDGTWTPAGGGRGDWDSSSSCSSSSASGGIGSDSFSMGKGSELEGSG